MGEDTRVDERDPRSFHQAPLSTSDSKDTNQSLL